jgi:hypothetical protein
MTYGTRIRSKIEDKYLNLGFIYFLSFYPVAEDEVVQKVIEAVSKERENIMTILKAFKVTKALGPQKW